jgi:hypothetical protein
MNQLIIIYMSFVNINTVVMLFHRAVFNLSWYYGSMVMLVLATSRYRQLQDTATSQLIGLSTYGLSTALH